MFSIPILDRENGDSMDYNRKRVIHYESRAAIDLSEEEIYVQNT